MGYYSDDVTEEELNKLENKIKREYSRAYREMKATADAYFETLATRYEQEYEAFQNGYYTEQEFKEWYLTQVQRGKGYEKMAEDLASRISNANQQASAYINDKTPSIYSLNYSYETYQIQNNTGVNYHAYDEQTIKNLLTGGENVVEFKIDDNYTIADYKKVGIDIKRDYEWNREKIESAVTSGILQGKSIDKLSDSFMTVMKRNRSSAIRNARTSVTSAQNAGRQLGYEQAVEMGIDLQKEWIATLDERTRSSHAEIDGERVPYDKTFSNGLRYPADNRGIPAEVYNCRCTMRAVLPNINDGARVTYKDWLAYQANIQTVPTKYEKENYSNILKRYNNLDNGAKLYDNLHKNALNEMNKKLFPTARQMGYTLNSIPKNKKVMDYTIAIKNANPRYKRGEVVTSNNGFKQNCQRVICAVEARCRGYDVTASYRILGVDELAQTYKNGNPNPDSWLKVFDGAVNRIKRIDAKDANEAINKIVDEMVNYGDGARAVLRFKHKTGGHVISVFNDNGKVYIGDGQSGTWKSNKLFNNVKLDSLAIVRIDDLKMTDALLDCVEVYK